LKELIEDLGASLIAVMHFNKKVDITNAMLRVSNSLAFVGLPRHVYSVTADPENGRKLFSRAKNNDAADTDNKTLAYHFSSIVVGSDPASGKPIQAPYIVWEPGYVDVSATEALAAVSENKAPGARERAKKFLLTTLADGAAVPVTEIQEAAEANGHAWRTVRRAQVDLKVIIEKKHGDKDGPWLWRLPTETEEADAHG
jgi:hypothetical protein